MVTLSPWGALKYISASSCASFLAVIVVALCLFGCEANYNVKNLLVKLKCEKKQNCKTCKQNKLRLKRLLLRAAWVKGLLNQIMLNQNVF